MDKILTNKEVEELILHNSSFGHSYSVVNHTHRIHPRQLTHNGKFKIETSESSHIEELNSFFPDKLDFSKNDADKAILSDRKNKWKSQQKINDEHNART